MKNKKEFNEISEHHYFPFTSIDEVASEYFLVTTETAGFCEMLRLLIQMKLNPNVIFKPLSEEALEYWLGVLMDMSEDLQLHSSRAQIELDELNSKVTQPLRDVAPAPDICAVIDIDRIHFKKTGEQNGKS